ncbi:Allophanate hydrolase 2 subunit 1 [Rhodovulum sp. P5]|uniref:5-oxoprolinase subunit PxpB n=1 Tax=Rhodovulum sp. P5 TaxID=1564506 RepID=UPI0009C2DBE7|nr:5-oxoprolinase subunit PxpB [Rhodovulum sp. P5]ARE41407.1 Allophanate hydrolase 2 subunit 1 [Rhodovulum sp. P5]
MGLTDLRISRLGIAGVLADAADGVFSEITQGRILALAFALRQTPGVTEVVPGMNNLLVEADPRQCTADAVETLLQRLWHEVEPAPSQDRLIEIPVVYGGAAAEDIGAWAAHAGLSVDQAIARHAAGHYTVAAVGAMPGFGYLSGLDPQLAMPRRKVPRTRVVAGAVIVGGAQAAVMPITAPSGWHIIGHTQVKLFDADAAEPCLFQPGDRVRFTVKEILA